MDVVCVGGLTLVLAVVVAELHCYSSSFSCYDHSVSLK